MKLSSSLQPKPIRLAVHPHIAKEENSNGSLIGISNSYTEKDPATQLNHLKQIIRILIKAGPEPDKHADSGKSFRDLAAELVENRKKDDGKWVDAGKEPRSPEFLQFLGTIEKRWPINDSGKTEITMSFPQNTRWRKSTHSNAQPSAPILRISSKNKAHPLLALPNRIQAGQKSVYPSQPIWHETNHFTTFSAQSSMEDHNQQHRRCILLEIETVIAPGRDMLRGIAKFSGEIHRWDTHHHAGNWALLHGTISGPSHIEPLSPDRRIDGVITRIYDDAGCKRAQELISRGIPVVDILGDHDDLTLPLVHTDDHAIAKVALRHLIGQGFGRFAFMGIEDTRWSVQRGSCFSREAAKRGEQPPSFTVSKSHQTNDQSEAGRIEEWLKNLKLPLGVFVSCDHIAPLLLNACTRLGITVPEELAIVGVNNDTVACNLCNPTLSSIDAAHFEIGYRAARMLNSFLEGITPESDTVLVPPSRLVVRGSSGELAISDPLVARAARFINRHAGSLIGVDDVVASVPLSRRELQRRFRSVTGRTIHASILEARMAIAKRLLGNPEYTVDAVAELSGFASRQHFSKTFKTQTGVTPAKYRREQTIR